MVHLDGTASPRYVRQDPADGQAHPRMLEGHIGGETAARNDRAALVLVGAYEDRRLPAAEGALVVHKACACPSDAARTGPHAAAFHGRALVEACRVVQTPKAVDHWERDRNCPAAAVPGYRGELRHSDRDRGAHLPLAARAYYHSLFHKRAKLTALEAAARGQWIGQTCPHHRHQSCLLAHGCHCSLPALALAPQLCWHRRQPHRCRRLASSCGHERRHLLVPSPPQGGPPSSGPVCVEPP